MNEEYGVKELMLAMYRDATQILLAQFKEVKFTLINELTSIGAKVELQG